MIATETTIPTEFASKYIQQLCKHFAHKVTVEYDTEKGLAALPHGPCHMEVRDNAIWFHCEGETEQHLAVSKSIVEQHLVKFAWREEISFDWQDSQPGYIPAG